MNSRSLTRTPGGVSSLHCGHEARPRLLDLFCGAGGCSAGYHRAGFDVTGVDTALKRQRDGTWADDHAMPMRYPFEFIKADAMTFPLEGYDAYAAWPPCQDHSISLNI